MFKALSDKYPNDPDYPQRVHDLTVLKAVIDGSLYDVLQFPFAEERSANGEYIPLAERRPSVRYNLCRIVVEDSIGLLFGENHFPTVNSDDESLTQFYADLIKDCQLNAAMIDAGIRGSVGSVAVQFKVLDGRPFYELMETTYLTPQWKPTAPDTLESVTEQYKTTKQALLDLGYTIEGTDPMSTQFWFRRDWTETEEVHYKPLNVKKWRLGKGTFERDDTRTVKHGLGFVPMVWIKNLPPYGDVDGWPTFKLGIDSQIEIEYQLSQGGRGLKYSSDPVLLIKNPAYGNGEMIKSASNALIVQGENGDAKLLEITGKAADAIIAYVKTLREFGIEVLHGNRMSAEKLSVAQSGKAMEMLNAALIGLSEKLKITYGEGAFVALLKMAVMASSKFPLNVGGKTYKGLSKTASLTLEWPAWYAPTSTDLLQKAQALTTNKDAGLISQETAVRNIAPDYDIEDITKELEAIKKEGAENDANEIDKQTKLAKATAPKGGDNA